MPGVNGLHSRSPKRFAKYGEAFRVLNFESDQGLSILLLLIISYFDTETYWLFLY